MMILWYLIIGLVILYLTVLAHLIRAENKGYDACNWWMEHNPGLHDKEDLAAFLLGMTIWPIRLMQFLILIPELYQTYPKKES